MAFELSMIKAELAAEKLVAPLPEAVAMAVVSDCFRSAGLAPLALAEWQRRARGAAKAWPGQLCMLGWLLGTPSARAATIEALAASRRQLGAVLDELMREIAPLQPEMIRANQFRQEELIRWWARAVGGEIAGESAEESRERLAKLDYKRALGELQAAEEARKQEAERRAKALAEAEAKAAEARGWRE